MYAGECARKFFACDEKRPNGKECGAEPYVLFNAVARAPIPSGLPEA